MSTDKLNNLFGIEGELIQETYCSEIVPVANDNIKQDIDDDYEFARKNLYDVIQKSNHALESAISLAKASEHPNAFAVVGQLAKTLLDANKDLLEVQKKVKELRSKEESSEQKKEVTNNNLFVGTTAELQKLLGS